MPKQTPLRLALLASVALVPAGGAVAQTAVEICGAGAVWAGGNAAGSDLSVANEPINLTAPVAGNAPLTTAFTLSAPADVRLEAASAGFEGDPTVELLSSSGSQMDFDDDGGGALNARLESGLEPGSYCARFGGFGDGVFSADLRLGRTEQEALTEGAILVEDVSCTIDTAATNLPSGLPQLNVASAGAAPFYRFTLEAPTALTLTAQNAEADPVLRVFDALGQQIGENDDFGGLNARLDFEDPLDAGTYCVGVGALSDNTLPITLSITEYDREAYLRALYDRGDTAPPLDGSYPVEDLGVVQSSLRQDLRVGLAANWVVFEMPEPGLALIEAVSITDGDPRIMVFDDFGRVIGEDDDGGGDLNSMLPARIPAGRYLIAVTDLNAEQGRQTTRLGITRYVPAR